MFDLIADWRQPEGRNVHSCSTRTDAEFALTLVRGQRWLSVETKRMSALKMTPSIRSAQVNLPYMG